MTVRFIQKSIKVGAAILTLATLQACAGSHTRTGSIDITLAEVNEQLDAYQQKTQTSGDATAQQAVADFKALQAEEGSTLYYSTATTTPGGNRPDIWMPLDLTSLVKMGTVPTTTPPALYAFFVVSPHSDGWRGALIIAGGSAPTSSSTTTPGAATGSTTATNTTATTGGTTTSTNGFRLVRGNLKNGSLAHMYDTSTTGVATGTAAGTSTTTPAAVATPAAPSTYLTADSFTFGSASENTDGTSALGVTSTVQGIVNAGQIDDSGFTMDLSLGTDTVIELQSSDVADGDLTDVIQVDLSKVETTGDLTYLGKINFVQPQ